MPHNNTKSNEEYTLEGQFQMVGMVFCPETIMPVDSNNHIGSPRSKQANSNSKSLFGIDGYSIFRNVQTYISSILKAQKMAIKVGWIFIYNCMGWISLGYSTIMAIVGNFDEVKQWILLLFSCLFAAIKIWQGYQNGALKREEVRAKRIENDERQFNLKVAHDKHVFKLQTKH